MHIAAGYSHYYNQRRLDKGGESTAAICVENLANWAEAVEEISTWPEYQPQPLRSLPHQAAYMGISKLFYKDESRRFGASLGSFKALGTPCVVYKILADEKNVTVCVATDGNQGRGLAYGAKIFGCRCVDYIHGHVSVGRADMMRDLGAVVIRIDGEYEAFVERAKEDARMNAWHFVSSTSWSDFDSGIPRNVMNAYMVIVEEALKMDPAVEDITHVFVCGGVGSIGAAVFLGFYTRFTHLKKTQRNEALALARFVVVEPLEADCLYQSAKKGEMCLSEGSLRTLMAGLTCRGPSPADWKILSWLASDFVTVPDSAAVEGMKVLASGRDGRDVPVVCGESSAANMGVMLQRPITQSSVRC
ncbi:tryptophan synthase beta subunit-like PLP-dependent enzyme [Thozetella sp. PMI_491]|nr:tryptophan synthase beta subunit-like PLP-dependent enzyme [Thozetella sp. PMI_491]